MRSAIILKVLLLVVPGVLFGQTTEPPNLTALQGAVSVRVVSSSRSDPTSLVRVTRIQLVDDHLTLEIDNTAPVTVIAVDIRYTLSGCHVEGSVGSFADARREPGMFSIDIPAHSRAWYEDRHMASQLAYAAITQKTRYLRSRPEVIAAAFVIGKKARWDNFGKPKQSVAEVDGAVCDKWVWNDALNAVRGFQPPAKLDGGFHKRYGSDTSLTFTCSVTDDVLTCAE